MGRRKLIETKEPIMDDDYCPEDEAKIERREDRVCEKRAALEEFDFERDCGEKQG